MLLTADVEKMADDVKLLAREVREHDRRLIRIETMIEVARGGMPGQPAPLRPAITERPRRRRRVAEETAQWEPAPTAEPPDGGEAAEDG